MKLIVASLVGLLLAKFIYLSPQSWGAFPIYFSATCPIWWLGFWLAWVLYFFRKNKQGKLLCLLPILWATFQLVPNSPLSQTIINGNKEKLKQFSVMTYNVKSFGLYDWYEDKPYFRPQMMKFIAQTNSDITCLQEFYTITEPNNRFNTLDTLRDLLKGNEYFLDSALVAGHEQTFGLAVFTKFKIIEKGKINLQSTGTNSAMYCDLDLGSQKIRLIQFHLESVNRLMDLKNHQPLSWLEKIASYFTAMRIRAIQVDAISKYIANSPYPIIACGDLNDFQWSYCYNKLTNKLIDAYKNSGWGVGSTFPSVNPIVRIDYIFYSPELLASASMVKQCTYSDHRPILTKFILQ